MKRPTLDVLIVEGEESVTDALSSTLARRGHRVTVVSPGTSPDWFPLSQARFERSAYRDSEALREAEAEERAQRGRAAAGAASSIRPRVATAPRRVAT